MPVQFLETNITEIRMELKVKEFTELVSKEALRVVPIQLYGMVQTEMVVAVEQVDKMQQVVAVEDMLILVIMEDHSRVTMVVAVEMLLELLIYLNLYLVVLGAKAVQMKMVTYQERVEMEEELFSFQLLQ